MKKTILILSVLLVITINANAQWQRLKSPNGGDICCFGNIGNNIYAGTFSHGIFLTKNKGESWVEKNKNLSPFITSMYIKGTEIYVGTTDGVYLSTNYGEKWTALNKTGLSSEWVISIAVSDSSIFVGTMDFGFFSSKNKGATWSAINLGKTYTSINTISIIDTCIYAGTDNGIFLSTNNGEEWKQLDSSLINFIVTTIATKEASIYAGTSHGVYVSTNNGENWTSISNGLPNYKINDIEIVDSKILIGTSNGIFYSIDNGTNWNSLNGNLQNIEVTTINAIENNIYIGTIGKGVFVLANNGLNWIERNEGLSDVNILSLAVNNNNIYVGGHSTGPFLLSNFGENWVSISNDLPNRRLAINSIFLGSSNIFVVTNHIGVYMSSNNGTNWNETNGLDNGFIKSIVSFNDDNIYAIAGSCIYKYYGGFYWGLVYNFYSTISSILVSESNIFVGTSDCGVFLSTDYGYNWIPVNNGLTNLQIRSLTKNETNLFLQDCNGDIYTSNNGGANWNEVKMNVSLGITILSIVGSGKNLYASTLEGLYVSTNNGIDWTNFSKGLPGNSLAVEYLKIEQNNTDVFVVAYGGIWKRPLSEIISIESIKKENIFSFFPNPAKENITVNYEYKTDAVLNFYNITGNLVKSEILKQNNQHININDLPNGIYLCEIKTNEYSVNQKLIIQK